MSSQGQTRKSQHSSQQGSHQSSQSQGSKSGGGLSNAAQKMRSGNPQERSEGAHELGQAGGHQSHKNDNRSSGNR